MEIGENPDFNELSNHLKKGLVKDFANYISDSKKTLKEKQISQINDHFKYYNDCISKLHGVVKNQSAQIKLTEITINQQQKDIDRLINKLVKQEELISKIPKERSKFLGLF